MGGCWLSPHPHLAPCLPMNRACHPTIFPPSPPSPSTPPPTHPSSPTSQTTITTASRTTLALGRNPTPPCWHVQASIFSYRRVHPCAPSRRTRPRSCSGPDGEA
ncbi:hypothetical protein ACKKBG_A05895 [Auxenochlorella protothecoides x Auxenochlorella symbiontica]